MPTDTVSLRLRYGEKTVRCFVLSFLALAAACNQQNTAETLQPVGEGNGEPARAEAEASVNQASRPAESTPAESIYVARLAQEVAVPEALLTGTLRIRDGCLVFDSRGQVTLALVPGETQVDSAARRVAIGKTMVPLDKEMRFGGGYYPAGHEVFAKLQNPVPANCPQAGTLIGDTI